MPFYYASPKIGHPWVVSFLIAGQPAANLQHQNTKIMSNIKTKLDEWEVKDIEDNSVIRVWVEHNTEMGNNSLPGLQVVTMGRMVNYEPLHVERWAYAAKKANTTEYLVEEGSWTVYPDTYIRQILVLGEKLTARVEVKVRSKDQPVIKEYELPFTSF